MSLTREAAGLSQLVVVVGWQGPDGIERVVDLHVGAIICGQDRRAQSGKHFVSPRNRVSPDGAVVHNGSPGASTGEGSLSIDLSGVPGDVAHVYVTGSIDAESSPGLTFGQLRRAYVQVADASSDVELARFDLPGDASIETAMVLGELYRRGAEWKFRAVGQGYADGLAGIARDYGITG